MKKILIATVYNSENCGSFWQAFALKCALEKLGYEVYHYKRNTRNTSHSFLVHIKHAFGAILKLKFSNVIEFFRLWFRYEKLIGEFNVCDKKSAVYNDIHKVIIGSDTLWNFEEPVFLNSSFVYLGHEFKGKSNISYAISVANTPKELFSEVVSRSGGINIEKCLVRDNSTYSCLESSDFQGEIVKVCDPTFLLEKTDFIEITKNAEKPRSNKFVVLYYFGEVPIELKTEIKKFAAAKNLKIVSLLYKRDWCDVSIPNDPFLMINYFSAANYVITNTFHGCAFSINFQKNFAVFDQGKNKVTELLADYECINHLFKDINQLSEVLSFSPAAKDIIIKYRTHSLKQLISSL